MAMRKKRILILKVKNLYRKQIQSRIASQMKVQKHFKHRSRGRVRCCSELSKLPPGPLIWCQMSWSQRKKASCQINCITAAAAAADSALICKYTRLIHFSICSNRHSRLNWFYGQDERPAVRASSGTTPM